MQDPLQCSLPRNLRTTRMASLTPSLVRLHSSYHDFVLPTALSVTTSLRQFLSCRVTCFSTKVQPTTGGDTKKRRKLQSKPALAKDTYYRHMIQMLESRDGERNLLLLACQQALTIDRPRILRRFSMMRTAISLWTASAH